MFKKKDNGYNQEDAYFEKLNQELIRKKAEELNKKRTEELEKNKTQEVKKQSPHPH